MISLRKDVKLGLLAGAVVLGCLLVYLMVTSLFGSSTTAELADATTSETSTPAVSPRTSGATAAPRNAGSNAVTPSTSSASPATGSIATAARPSTAASTANPQSRTGSSPTAGATASSPAGTSGAPVDPWAQAFATGEVKPNLSNPATSVTATPTQPASPVNSVLNAIRNPAAGSNTAGTNAPMFATRPQSAAGNEAAKSHTVRFGDTLTSIAVEYYGDAKHYPALLKANTGLDPNRLQIGQTITIPAIDAKVSAGESADPMGAIDPNKQYVIQPGDSLSRISSKLYGTGSKWEAIYKANATLIGSDPAKLKVGSVLALPEPPTQR